MNKILLVSIVCVLIIGISYYQAYAEDDDTPTKEDTTAKELLIKVATGRGSDSETGMRELGESWIIEGVTIIPKGVTVTGLIVIVETPKEGLRCTFLYRLSDAFQMYLHQFYVTKTASDMPFEKETCEGYNKQKTKKISITIYEKTGEIAWDVSSVVKKKP